MALRSFAEVLLKNDETERLKVVRDLSSWNLQKVLVGSFLLSHLRQEPSQIKVENQARFANSTRQYVFPLLSGFLMDES